MLKKAERRQIVMFVLTRVCFKDVSWAGACTKSSCHMRRSGGGVVARCTYHQPQGQLGARCLPHSQVYRCCINDTMSFKTKERDIRARGKIRDESCNCIMTNDHAHHATVEPATSVFIPHLTVLCLRHEDSAEWRAGLVSTKSHTNTPVTPT